MHSMHSSTSGIRTFNQAVAQESTTRSFQCSHCTLILKSKVFLFEHLNEVHGFDVDGALRNAGLKNTGTNKASTDNNRNASENKFECQHCDLKACNRDILNEHEKQCKKSENQNVIGNLIISKNPETKIVLTHQHKEAAGAKEISSAFSVMPISKTKCKLNSSKDGKTYQTPLQTITKYFAASSRSKGNPPAKLADSPVLLDNTKGTLILQESPSDSSPNSSGVFKVTAKPTIDIVKGLSDRFLLDDHFLIPDPKPPKPKEKFAETVPNNKRTSNESPKSPPAKKAKSDKEEIGVQEKAVASKQQSSNNKKLSFEFSEDEEENKVNRVNRDTQRTEIYFCKHCDYSDVSVRCVSTHYQNDHPYIRFNTVYIQDPSDQSATFRCLECPVEFSTRADLKRHYKEHHAEAPNVFTIQSCEHRLVFKCFVCPLTTNVLKAMKEHYQEKHPTHKVDNPLMFCRYLVTGSQEEKTAPSPEKPHGIPHGSAQIVCKEVKNAPSPQHPTSKGADVALYHCNNCEFSHKSVVVVHVHYQKIHPEKQITIDKIKQSACAMSHTTLQMSPDQSPNSTTIKQKSPPQKDISDSLEETRYKSEVSQQTEISSSLINPKHTPKASKTHSESPRAKKVESAEDRSKGKKLPNKRNKEMSAGINSSSCRSPNELFYCQFCSYSNPRIKSVVGHHNAKHSAHAPAGIEDIVRYRAKVLKKNLRSETEASARASFSDCKSSKEVETCSEIEPEHEEDEAADASMRKYNAYAHAENLFYCRKCNYGNTSAQGVLTHQARVHQTNNSRLEHVIEYTTLIRDEIEKSKSQVKDLSFLTHLPLPLLNKGDENMFFCHFCNYRQSTVNQVLGHYYRKHCGFVVKGEQIHQYTSMVLRQTQTSQLKTAANQEVSHITLGEKENMNEKTKKLGNVLASPSITASQTQRTLQCYKCSYSTQYVYLLRKHMCKIHKSNRTVAQILKVCFKQGTLQAGYHCNFCVFSHTKASAVYKHYQEQHTARRVSLEYVTTQLYVGPETKPPKKKKSRIHTSGTSDSDGTDGSLPSQRSRQNENKTYSCRACSFKGSSMSSITRHYRAVHPWSVKEDGSVLDVINSKKQNSNKQTEDNNEMPVSLDTYQASLEFDDSPGSSHESVSSTSFECPFCPASFSTQHGLSTHSGMKHQNDITENVDEKQEEQEQEQIQTREHVFKCPHCTYVNTNYHGVLTHCQMRHPGLESRADSLYLNGAHSQNWEDCLKRKGSGLRLIGYMCNTCQQIYATLEKLNKHCEKSHNGTIANTERNTTTSAPKLSAVSKKKHNSFSNKGSVSKVSFLSKKKYAVIRCQHCSYVCTTKLALGRHLHVRHKNASASKAQDCSYKCALCSNSYFRKKFLGSHYVNKHGKKAYLKYYEPQNKQVLEKPAPTVPDQLLTKQQGNTSEACQSSTTAEENKKLVFRCPSCPYVNASFHGILTHCQMKHPEVVARADNLQTDEILLTNMVGCTMGKGSNERGYMCKKCPQIHVSLKKLKIHCERDHGTKGTASEDSIEIEKQPDHGSWGSALEAVPLKHKILEVSSTEDKKLVFRCPSCPYVNASFHGILTHCQMKHPEVVARADELQTDEILVSNMVGCTMGKGSNERGYMCKKCPQIHVSLSKLKIHCERDHRAEGTAFEDSVEIEKQYDHGSRGSVLEAVPLKNKTLEVSSTENKKLVFKCPICPYVNASFYGCLTHCQIKHPEVVARADEPQTHEILVSNMIGYTMGKGSNERGYMCKKCPQIHVSLKKLKIHCERDHDQAEGTASEDSIEIEKQPDHACGTSVLRAVSLKTKTSAVSSTEIGLSHQMGTPKTCRSILSVKNKELLYKCHICSYMGSCRKYLHCHYKKTHKLDAFTTCRLLQRYNKRNRAKNLPEAESDQSAHVKCKICPNLKFCSSQMLIAHYNTFHSSDCILNFIVLSKASKKSTGLYKCALCKKQMNGIRKLWHHLDGHREGKKNIAKGSLAITTTPEAKSIELCPQDELPMLETVEELAQWNVTPVETFTLPSSPPATPSKDDQEQPELESRDGKQTCKQCGRQFMSLKGLRSHERSHAALAAIKKKLNNLSTSERKQDINKYIIYKPGTVKPFICSLCSYRTTFMSLWRSHVLKKHQDVNMAPAESDNQDKESAQRVDMEPPNLSEELNNLPELDEQPEVTEISLYSEPPDVQRQLNHYSLMAQAGAQSEANVQGTKLPRNSLLHCEICNFNTGHLSSIRRHYLNRHGKKILRCKDCNFFTGSRRTLEMHMETGHSTCQSEPTHQKDLRCPFCLYQTKNKNNMIDHIVLHREERVVPIEVRRSKLSHYLQGIVFRCHKCTFTSGSAENLRSHMMRHDDIKPYKCRLCYFDCIQLSDLEAHLSDKHQVVRNHELVGQISLDQLEARVGRMTEEEEEPLSDLEHPNNDSQDVKTEEICTDCDEVPHEAQAENLADNNIRENVTHQMKEAYQRQGQDDKNGNEGGPAKSSVSELQFDNTKPNSIVQEKHEQDPQEQAEIVFLPDIAKRQGIENRAKQKVDEGNNDIQLEDCNYPEKERWTNENQAQPKLRDREDSSVTLTRPKEEAAEGSSTCGKIAEKVQAYKLHFKALRHKTLNIEARIEDDILRHVLLLDEDGSIRKIHKKADLERTVKIEQSFEHEATDNVHNVIPLLNEESCITLAHNRKNPLNREVISAFTQKNHGQANNVRDHERFTVQRHWLNLSPNCRQLKISHKEILGVSFTNCKEEQVQNQKNHEEIRDSYEEMPVLENEYLKEEMRPGGSCKEEDQNEHLEPKQDKEDEMVTEDGENRCTKQKHQDDGGIKQASNPHVPKGALEVTDGEAEVLRSATTEEKMFTCEFCGRNLMNSSELERHRMRHGI